MSPRLAGSSETHVATARSRRRGAALEDALLQAAWAEVKDVGYAKLTIEGVAERAAAHKTVIYRRWPNRAVLVQSALRHRLGLLAEDVPDTGDLRQDVITVLCRYRDYVAEIGPDIIAGLLSEAADLSQDLYNAIPGVIITVLERAAGRGEVRVDRITPRIAALPDTLLRHELFSPEGDASDASIAAITDEVFLPLVLDGTAGRQGDRAERAAHLAPDKWSPS
jgi:AcrR family transcriptional regulator